MFLDIVLSIIIILLIFREGLLPVKKEIETPNIINTEPFNDLKKIFKIINSNIDEGIAFLDIKGNILNVNSKWHIFFSKINKRGFIIGSNFYENMKDSFYDTEIIKNSKEFLDIYEKDIILTKYKMTIKIISVDCKIIKAIVFLKEGILYELH